MFRVILITVISAPPELTKIIFQETPQMMNSADLCEGVLRRSPFMDLAGFNIITSIPLEPMHAFHLGVTSSIVRKLFFKAGVFGKTERNEMSEALSALLVQTKLPSDFSRRTDVLDAANAKASTWQLLGHICVLRISRQSGACATSEEAAANLCLHCQNGVQQ
jgi:hypothetical protein